MEKKQVMQNILWLAHVVSPWLVDAFNQFNGYRYLVKYFGLKQRQNVIAFMRSAITVLIGCTCITCVLRTIHFPSAIYAKCGNSISCIALRGDTMPSVANMRLWTTAFDIDQLQQYFTILWKQPTCRRIVLCYGVWLFLHWDYLPWIRRRYALHMEYREKVFSNITVLQIQPIIIKLIETRTYNFIINTF